MTHSSPLKTSRSSISSKGAQKLIQSGEILDAVSSSFFITNEQLQIVYHNDAFVRDLEYAPEENFTGFRPGDVLGCRFAKESEHGCGTTRKCQLCSFRGCIIDAMKEGKTVRRDATVLHTNNRILNYRIEATPFILDEGHFISVSSIDITDFKRKELMESVFFHDLINLSGSLSGYLEVIGSLPPEEVITHFPLLKNIADELLDEIVSQRQLARAEQNRLEADMAQISTNILLTEIKNQTEFHPSFRNRNLEIDNKEHFMFVSDYRLLSRVVINMLKNAAEATEKGNTIRLTVKKENDEITFAVHNKEYISPEIQDNLFTFGYSTKGPGRGIGTYGMRIIGENLLKGKVCFTSSPEEGTIFYLSLPADLPVSESYF